MAFWAWLRDTFAAGETANATVSSPNSVGPGYNPGNPHGFTDQNILEATASRALARPRSSPWSGWPAEWGTPDWGDLGDLEGRIGALVDTAWDCLDLNASVLSSMPVYRLRNGEVTFPLGWMKNPNPDVYTSWSEFAKQLFWDYQMGEAFVFASDWYTNGSPSVLTVLPKSMVKVKMDGLRRRYWIGNVELNTDPERPELLHIRYKSRSNKAHGVGPLEEAGARLTTAGVLQRQLDSVAETGGVPPYILEVERRLNKAESDDLLYQWGDSRAKSAGKPAIVSGGTKVTPMQQPSAKDMALLELSQFTESRICVKLGVPPFLMGLPSGGDSMTYSNVSQLFDFHDRASLKTKAAHVMAALSWWALPPAESAELNRDEYSRPGMLERAQSYDILNRIKALSPAEVRTMERLHGNGAGGITGLDGSATGGAPEAGASVEELTTMIQKIYLGVGAVLTVDEARAILNRAGAGLTGPFQPPEPPQQPMGGTGA